MPSTYNGIGTWYHGKTDIHRLKGSCEFCHNIGDLTSYDTTLYFVVFFVPVIPISKYRVLQQCPRCEKHRVVKSKQWQEMKNKNTQEVFERLDKNPKDREALMEGLGSVISYQDPELFERLIPLANALPEDADVQFQLGATYSYFARRAEATDAYKKSLLAEDRPQTRELMATNLLREGVPDEAEPLVRHILDEKIADKVYLPFLLVETYQSQGKHQQALDMLNDMVAAFPDLENDKDIKKYRADSTKHLNTGKALKRVTLVDSNRAGVEKGSNWSKWVPAIIALSLLGGWLGRTIWLGSNCTVHLINGGSKPYQVMVNNQPYTLMPGQAVPALVQEGDVVVEAVDPKLEISPVQCKVETPFFTRAFSRPVFVINPDETAVLIQETTIYAVNPPMPPAPVFLKSQAFQQLPEPDYLFATFPQSIPVKKNQNITKTRLSVYHWPSVNQQLEYFIDEVKDEARLTMLVKRLAQIDPDDMLLFTWLKGHLKPEETLKFVQPRLDQSPLLIDWHRAYQDINISDNKLSEMIPLYTNRLEKASQADKSAAKYLLGRLLDDPRGFAMIREAAQGNDASLFAMYVTGNLALLAGNFEEARQWTDKMANRDRSNPLTYKLMREVLMAQKKYSDLDQYLTLPSASQPDPMTLLLERYRLALMRNDTVIAGDLKNQVLALIRREAPQQVGMLESLLKTVEIIVRGDAAAYLTSTKLDQVSNHLSVPVLKGDLKGAEDIYEQSKNQPEHKLLNASLLYLLAKSKKNDTLTQEYWETIKKELQTSARTAKTFHEMLAGKAPFKFETARDTYIDAGNKRAVLLVLADRFPQDAIALKALAAKLNYQRDAHSLAVKKFLNDAKTAPEKK